MVKTIKHTKGYILEFRPEHPRANPYQYVLQHILVVEKDIGRYLEGVEEVHHINLKKSDNRIENLKLCKNRAEHMRYHAGWWQLKGKWWKKCVSCKQPFEVIRNNFYQRSTGKWYTNCIRCTSTKNEKYRNII